MKKWFCVGEMSNKDDIIKQHLQLVIRIQWTFYSVEIIDQYYAALLLILM